MELVAIPIGHTGTTLQRTFDDLTAALFTVRPNVEQAKATWGVIDFDTDSNATSHGYQLFKLLLDLLMDFTHSCLLDIVRSKKV